ncbi:MAG TPA: hypothetical protein PKI68_08555, partial [Pontiellaceae bacterium]|nr:hypothetical protein [Pontiellaceae bacterium]
MKTRLWIGISVAAAGVAAAALFFYFRPAAVPPAETLLPKDTIYYCGTRSPLKVKAAVAALDLQKILQESAGLTEADSRTVSDWISRVQGIHAGFRSFTLVPMVLDAAVILEGRFDRPLTGILSPALQQKIQAEEPYRGVAFRKMLLPIRKNFAMELYITDPVQDRILVAFSRRTLTEMIDRMQDGGPSLAGHPAFREMLARKELRRADLIQYVDTAAFLGLFRDWAKSMPQPQFKTLVDLVWNELRLADYG